MEPWDILCLISWFITILAAAGWIGWGLCHDKLTKLMSECKKQAKEIEGLKKKVIELKKEIIFIKFENASGLSKKQVEENE